MTNLIHKNQTTKQRKLPTCLDVKLPPEKLGSRKGKFHTGLNEKLPTVSGVKKPVSNTLFLDTLAQVSRNGSDTDRQKRSNAYYKRARVKFITNEIIFPLIDLNSPLKKSYWNTFHCVNILLQDGKKITGKYCNNRCCFVCNRIRTAKLINGYLPAVKSKVKEPYFITLTIPSVPSSELKASIDEMIKTINSIENKFRNRKKYKKYFNHFRNRENFRLPGIRHRKNFRLVGIRKLEANYNVIKCKYNPHFHFIVDTRHAGLALISEWLNRYPDAVMEAQDIRKADEETMIEMFKYCTKLITKNELTRVNDKVIIKVHAKALDTIFQAMYNRRIFQPMGIVKQPVSEDVEEIESQVLEQLRDEINVWTWEQEVSDWVASDGELLTGCNAHEKYKVIQKPISEDEDIKGIESKLPEQISEDIKEIESKLPEQTKYDINNDFTNWSYKETVREFEKYKVIQK